MNEVWQAAGVVGALPPDFLTSAEANEALRAVRVKRAVASDPSSFRRPLPTELGSERLLDLGQRLASWTARYDADATAALQTVNPRTALNLAYFGAALSRLRGRPAPHEVTMRRWIWIVAAAGGGHGTPGSGLHPFIQAAQDWRNLSLVRSFLSPADMWGVEDLTAMDQGLLLGARSHVGWGAAQVASHIAELSDGTVPSKSLHELLSNVHRIASEPGWMQGNPAPIADSARAVAERMSVDAGVYASAEFSALNAARTAALKPFVQFDEALLPANLEGATVDIHVPVLDLARSARTSNESAALMERVCARVLEQCPGLTTRVGDVYLHSTTTEETAEVDVFASDRASRHFLDAEVKAHYEDRDIPTTPKLYKAGFRGSLAQLAERRRVFLDGAYATFAVND